MPPGGNIPRSREGSGHNPTCSKISKVGGLPGTPKLRCCKNKTWRISATSSPSRWGRPWGRFQSGHAPFSPHPASPPPRAGCLRPIGVPRAGGLESPHSLRGGGGGSVPSCASRSSESRLLASFCFGALIVEGETSAGSEGLVRLGTNWWDLMGMTGRERGRKKQSGGQGEGFE